MTFGWAFCICIGMFIARFGKHLGHLWFIVHVTLNTIGVICVLVGFIIAIVMSQDDFKQVSSHDVNVIFQVSKSCLGACLDWTIYCDWSCASSALGNSSG